MRETRETSIAPEHRDRRGNPITRKNLFTSLMIGFAIGVVAGTPIGWFSHRIYAQQRAARVLLCRQQSFGLPEAQLQARCGSVY